MGGKTTATQRWKAITAFRMRYNGDTNNKIAEFIGVPVGSVPTLVKLGERLDSLNDGVGVRK